MSRPADLLPQKFAPYHQRRMETQKFITKHKSKARQIGLALSSSFEIHIHYMLIKDSPICAEQQVMDLMNSLGSQSFLNWKLLIYTQQFPSFVHDPAWLSEDGRLVFLSQENGLYDHPARPLSEDGAVFDLYISRPGYLAEEALLEMVSIYSQHRDNGHELDLLYWEEDYHLSPDSKKTLPLYKPAWDTHRLYCDNFIKGAFFVRRCPAHELACLSDPNWGYQTLLSLSCKMQDYQIAHSPICLFHHSLPPGDRNQAERACARSFVNNHAPHFDLIDTDHGTSRLMPRDIQDMPRVSVIIPTRNQLHHMTMVCQGLWERTDYENLEILIIDNGSDCQETLDFLQEAATRNDTCVLRLDQPFNYARLNNIAARQAKGDILLFLNNDIEILEDDWLQEMVFHALQPNVGAVGALLLYPDKRIQHAGITGGEKMVHNMGARQPLDWINQSGLGFVAQPLSAVTAACMAIRKDIFEDIGGFNEEFTIDYNDVDLCFRLLDLGYQNIWTPHALLIHHESVSRGSSTQEKDPVSLQRAKREYSLLNHLWWHKIHHDRLLNFHWSIEQNTQLIDDDFHAFYNHPCWIKTQEEI